MDILPVVVGIVVIVLGILVSIALHEVGHMVPAKKFGVRVSEYMVGFGPTLWSRKKGETEYGLKAIPLGGYVRLVGMMPPARPGARSRGGFFGQVIADAREASVSEIRPGEEHRAFYHLSTPKKLVVMLGGPVMNLVIAVVLLAVVLVGIGLPTFTTTVSSVTSCVPDAVDADGVPSCGAEAEASPASEAGIRIGDEIISYDGHSVASWDSLVARIEANAGTTADLVVRRGTSYVPVTVTLATREVSVESPGAASDDSRREPAAVGYLGVAPTVEREPLPPSRVPAETWYMMSQTGYAIATLPVRVYEAGVQAFSPQERSPSSVMSVVGIGQVAVEAVEADAGFVATLQLLLSVLAALNIALFVFNLVPLLPLDGGHVVNALFEGGRRTLARLRDRPAPGPADVARLMPVAYVVFGTLMVATVVLIAADIVDPVRLL